MSIIRNESGSNLSIWTTVLGDGNYHNPSVPPVTIDDIKRVDETAFSILEANIHNRRIMAHNISFNRITDPQALTCVHKAKYNFKLPYLPSTGQINFNGQTIEGGLFVWDGVTAQLDYGLAFQWIINPWDPNYKKLFFWNGSSWTSFNTNLEPDTQFHEIEFTLDIPNANATIKLDGVPFVQNVFSITPKTGWGTTVDARFQAETISIFPPETGPIPMQKVDFKDWEWNWLTTIV